ncbi:putative cytokinetic ring protein SteA [Alkaliphilus serpentinus]|uniref:SteA-like C-terminal domain-containing protein n=1 Tax=Alkaliphilus serpentinus TaxID=1482731 RepID=A0A833MD59_9FIRM|nr:putative cytokinetic ring protein SteA [Alkaliphilus serpentinus]KAB3527380.1 hypothetical protein F8153_12360 [Alkaliphilus serpentinus]
MNLKGPVKLDKKTKQLVSRLNPMDIAVIHHRDLDEIAAKSLVDHKVKGVINCDSFISGKYPNRGPELLLNYKIPMYEVVEGNVFCHLKDGASIEIRENTLWYEGRPIAKLKLYTLEDIKSSLVKGEKNLQLELDKFIDNTLLYASREKNLLLKNVKLPNFKTQIKGKHVLVVVRGKNYKEDLETILPYIREEKPVLIGVDGGGDAIMDYGYIPDILIGDMDSVSDECIQKSKEVIVHGYPDGRAPGMERVSKLRRDGMIFPSAGTSEDVAMLLAFEKKAELIVAVGTHTNIVDFLEKGRAGMASTLLVRMKIGTKLVDAKGVNQLYKSTIGSRYLIWLGLASIVPITIIIFNSKPIRYLLRVLHLRIRLFLDM